MASTALLELYRAGGWSEALGQSLAVTLQESMRRVIDMLSVKKIEIPESKDVDSIIRAKPHPDVELQVKETRRREARRRKAELESKLEAVKESLSKLDEEDGGETQVKLSLQDSKLRKQYMTEEQRKAQEATDFAKKMHEDQVERDRRRRQKESELQQRSQMEQDDLEEQRRLKAEEDEYNKQQRLAEMRSKAEARHALNEQLWRTEQESRRMMSKPLYKKIEETYVTDRLMPELERRKEELAKKRQGFKPITREELEEHARAADEKRQEVDARRSQEKSLKHDDLPSSPSRPHPSKFTLSVLQQEQEAKADQEIKLQEKRRLAEKQRLYAATVKEMYAPTIDTLKQKEMLLMQERLKNPVKSLAMRSKSSVEKETSRSYMRSSLGEEEYSDAPKISCRKSKKNSMIPEKKPRPEPKHLDYLGERRKYRENYAQGEVSVRGMDLNELDEEGMDSEPKAQNLIRRTQRLEKEARRQELLLSSAHPANMHRLEAVDKVNDMLIDSIKAKLTLLDQDS
jgi:hypothetical protein